MELEMNLSCKRCRSRHKSHEQSETACKIKHVNTSIQGNHESNHNAYETIDGKSSRELFFGSDQTFNMYSKLFSRCPHFTTEERERWSCKRNSCHGCIHRSSTFVCCQFSQRANASFHGLHSCDKRRRRHELCSSALNFSALQFRKRNECVCQNRQCCCCQCAISNNENFHLHPHKDISCSTRTKELEKEVVPTIRVCRNCGSFPSEEYIVSDVEHTNEPVSDCQDGTRTSSITEETKIITPETEKQKHEEGFLQLSLKIPQQPILKVEGFCKTDLKLLPPEVSEWLKGRNFFRSFISQSEEVKQVDHYVSPYLSCIKSSNKNPGTSLSLLHQGKESLNYSEIKQASTTMPDLNLLPSVMNDCSSIKLLEYQSSDLHSNSSSIHTKEEPHFSQLDKMSTQGRSDYKDKGCYKSAALPYHELESSINHTMIRCNGVFKASHQSDVQLNASSISCATECSKLSNGQGHLNGNAEVLADVAVYDSKDDHCKQNPLHSLRDQVNAEENSEKGLAPKLILAEQEAQIISEGNNLSGNVIRTGMKENVDDDINLMQSHSMQPADKSGQYSFLDLGQPVDYSGIVEISCREDELVDNGKPDMAIQSEKIMLEEYGLQKDLTMKGLENDTIAEENLVSGRSVDNYKADQNPRNGGPNETSRVQRKNFVHKNHSADNGDDPTVNRTKAKFSALEHNLINSQLASSAQHIADSQCAEAPVQLSNTKFRRWDKGILCDLCGQGPSLMNGEWYAWCCGCRLSYCRCTAEHKRQLLRAMSRKGKSSSKWKGYQWSGVVHRMCGIWSSLVYEKDDSGDQLEGLSNAVRKGRSFICVECKRFGATLGCRKENCKRSFHYPCVNRLATQLRCRMWEGFKIPVSCYYHRYADEYCITSKKRKNNIYAKYRNNADNGVKRNRNDPTYVEKSIHEDISLQQNTMVKDYPCMKTEDLTKEITGNVDDVHMSSHLSSDFKNRTGGNLTVSNKEVDGPTSNGRHQSDKETSSMKDPDEIKYLGQKLICEDISNGTEVIKIPCTNDIDDDAIPKFKYISRNRFTKQAAIIQKVAVSNMEKQPKACNGCNELDMDDPEISISVHMHRNDCTRDQDDRIDWQGEPMLGRLAYDCYGRLQLGLATQDVVECNARCPCGSSCLNRELQRGLKVRLEVFRTQDQRWGVRAVEQIPRGKFVIEYVGEVLSQHEATERTKKTDDYNFRYLFSMDHPSVPQKDQLVVDIFKMSNVIRFISDSRAGNLSIHRVYTDTMDYMIYRIGMYACRDIECGEELTYDYNYVPTKEEGVCF